MSPLTCSTGFVCGTYLLSTSESPPLRIIVHVSTLSPLLSSSRWLVREACLGDSHLSVATKLLSERQGQTAQSVPRANPRGLFQPEWHKENSSMEVQLDISESWAWLKGSRPCSFRRKQRITGSIQSWGRVCGDMLEPQRAGRQSLLWEPDSVVIQIRFFSVVSCGHTPIANGSGNVLLLPENLPKILACQEQR